MSHSTPPPWHWTRIYTHTTHNKRPYMEDVVLLDEHCQHRIPSLKHIFPGIQRSAAFAIFDGHAGARAARFCVENFHKIMEREGRKLVDLLKRKPDESFDEPDLMVSLLTSTMRALEGDFCNVALKKNLRDGTTALVLFFLNNRLYSANVGDCRATMWKLGKLEQLTTDHSPENTMERARVESLGGYVARKKGQSDYRIFPPGIAVARSIGDVRWKRPIEYLSPEPEIKVHRLNGTIRYIVLTSDGVTAALDNDGVGQVMRKFLGKWSKEDLGRSPSRKFRLNSTPSTSTSRDPEATPNLIVEDIETNARGASFSPRDNLTAAPEDISTEEAKVMPPSPPSRERSVRLPSESTSEEEAPAPPPKRRWCACGGKGIEHTSLPLTQLSGKVFGGKRGKLSAPISATEQGAGGGRSPKVAPGVVVAKEDDPAYALAQAAIDKGSLDNISVIVLRFPSGY